VTLERIGGILLGVAALVGVVALLTTRDRSTLRAPSGPGIQLPDLGNVRGAPGATPSSPAAAPPASGPHAPVPVQRDGVRLSADQVLRALELGDVVLVYGSSSAEPVLRTLADAAAAPFSPGLAAAGDAVVLDRDPRYRGVTALAWRHVLHARSPADPALGGFVSYWLGLGARHH
jgi:Protein of unknown function (DUF3105)